MEMVLSSEPYLKMLRVGSVVGSEVGSTCLGGLQSSDVAAALSCVDEERKRLALLVGGNAGGAADFNWLVHHLRHTLCSDNYLWFDGRLFRKDSSYRDRVCRVLLLAVKRLEGSDWSVRDGKRFRLMTNADRADFVGVDRSNYHRVWRGREADLFAVVKQWCVDADWVLFNQLSERRVAV